MKRSNTAKLNFQAYHILLILLFSLLVIFSKGIFVYAAEQNRELFAGGSGTESDPYVITTKEHLNNVRTAMDAVYRMDADIIFTEEDFAENGAFYNEGKGWLPLGKAENSSQSDTVFRGKFDGNSHVIKGLYINRPEELDTGLFKYLGGTIESLGLEDGEIVGNRRVGAIVGMVETNSAKYERIIQACYNTCKVTAVSGYAAGIAGEGRGTIKDCYNAGEIISVGYATAGGIVPMLQGGGMISGCYNAGNITSSGGYAVGGIVGESCWNTANTPISNCYNIGNISGTAAGGIVGRAYKGISNCYNLGTVDTYGIGGDGNAVNCYYRDNIDCGFSGGGDSETENGKTKKCTLNEMRREETFAGFDFESVWVLTSTCDYPYPTLRNAANAQIQNQHILNTAIAIDSANFPDDKFRTYIAANFDINQNGELSTEEIVNVTAIACGYKSIQDLTGVEHFYKLKYLYCYSNKLRSLDVRANPNLEYLHCYSNQLTALDVSQNKNLTNLECYSNQLEQLDVSKNLKLRSLNCSYNRLTSLDISKNTELSTFECEDNYYQVELGADRTFDFSTLPGNFDIGRVQVWYCGQWIGDTLIAFDDDESTVQYYYDDGKTQISLVFILTTDREEDGVLKVDAKNFPDQSFRRAVKKSFDYNKDGFLTQKEIDEATSITCKRNGIESLKGIELFPNLKTLICNNNGLTELDLSKNTKLRYLACYSNQLTELDLSNNLELETLSCESNRIRSLNVSKNAALQFLKCGSNCLASVDISNNKNLASSSASTLFSCGANMHFVHINSDRCVDLDKLPGGFNYRKASNWSGGTVSSNILTFETGNNIVTYTYNCGYDKKETFKLKIHDVDEYSTWNSNGDGTHTRKCTWAPCAFPQTEQCTGGTATTTEQAICEVCGQPYGDLVPRVFISGKTAIGRVGRDVTVALYVNENPGIAALNMKLAYDKDVLEFVSAANGKIFPSSFDVVKGAQEGVKILSWTNGGAGKDVIKKGKLVTLKFKVKENTAVEATKISLLCADQESSAANLAGKSIALEGSGVVMRIVETLYGDANDNGQVDFADVLQMKRFLAGWAGYAVYEKAADVNKSGSVNKDDIMILERHVAGWRGYESLPRPTAEQKGA